MKRFLSMLAGAVTVLVCTGVVLLAYEVRSNNTAAPASEPGPSQEIATNAEGEAGGEPEEESDAAGPDTPVAGVASNEPEDRRPPDVEQVEAQLLRDGVTAIAVSLTDPSGVTRGVADAELRFDTATGEICYQLDAFGISAPYQAAIRLGVGGQEGPVVVDLGPQAPSAIGCVASDLETTTAILADPTGHYLSLPDPYLGVDLRSQLAAAQSEGTLGFDPDGGGATIQVERGAVVLVGVVPNQQTSDDLAGLFDPVADRITVVNELQIVPGAPAPSGRLFVSDDVLFLPGSDTLESPDQSVLVDVALILQAQPSWRVRVVGHTDSTGEEDFNLRLSQQRADAVRDYLVSVGVSADLLATAGAGSSRPIDDNATPEGRARNRRIELIIS